MTKKKRLRDYSPREQTAIGFVLVVSLAIVGVAERDIQHRPDEEIRGPKLLWRALSLNAIGALAYFGVGRKRQGEAPTA